MKYPTITGSARPCLVCLLTAPSLIFFASALNVLAGNVALNKPATAGSSYLGSVPALAVDGDVDTYWNGGGHGSPGSSMWLKVDLQAAFNLQRVVLRSPGGSHVYELFGSLDDTNWIQLASNIVVTTLAPVMIDTEGVAFRYLRCDVTGGDDWASLAELEAYAGVTISTITVNPGVVQLTLTNCLSDMTNTVERTFDLTDPSGWTALTNLTGVSGGIVWEDAISTEWTRAFYRVRSK
jgi:hypothetical protein